MGRLTKTLLIANFLFWVYFWLAFAQASYPFRPDPFGHPAGTGYTFWGHSIAVVENGLSYPFFRVMFYAEFPSFATAILVVRVFSPHLLLYGFFAGISKGGWLLLAVMTISFFQWYLIGRLGQGIQRRWYRRNAGIRN
ncbi:MAG TPA: hypothetical protein VKR59_01495 [Terriglobales bacterium]|nr:hypothetical protein [Terriglobales bacterium]